MYIQVPLKYKDSKLNEGDAMVAAYLTMINDRYGWEDYYVINSYDFKRLYSDRAYSAQSDSNIFSKLREHMYIIGLDQHNWALKFKYKNVNEFVQNRGVKKMPITFKYKIKNTRSIMVWCFLMGQWSSEKEIVNVECKDILPHKESQRSLQRLQHLNFQPDNLNV